MQVSQATAAKLVVDPVVSFAATSDRKLLSTKRHENHHHHHHRHATTHRNARYLEDNSREQQQPQLYDQVQYTEIPIINTTRRSNPTNSETTQVSLFIYNGDDLEFEILKRKLHIITFAENL